MSKASTASHLADSDAGIWKKIGTHWDEKYEIILGILVVGVLFVSAVKTISAQTAGEFLFIIGFGWLLFRGRMNLWLPYLLGMMFMLFVFL
jgi:hypothetical protein